MTLFDVFERTEIGPRPYSESPFEYLNRSKGARAARTRELLERWFQDYPEKDRAELRARFRRDDFDAAFFELFCHALLRALGCRVTVHPELPEGRPDFLARPPNGDPFLLEASVARDETEEERGVRKVQEQILDGINKLRSRNFFLELSLDRVSRRAASSRRIRAFLSDWLSGLDPDEVARECEEEGGFLALPRVVYETEDVRLTFRAIPVEPESRGEIDRPLGMHGPGEPVRVEAAEPIRAKVRDKAGAHGEPGVPYVVAVNATGTYSPSLHDVADALFGREEAVLVRNPEGMPSTVRKARARNGALSPTQNTRVSAVLVGMPLHRGNLADAPLVLAKNPWAAHPLGDILDPVRELVAEEEGMEERPGRTTGEILGLDPDWPSDD